MPEPTIDFRLRLFSPETGRLEETITPYDEGREDRQIDRLLAYRDDHPEFDAFLDIIWRGAVVFTETRRSVLFPDQATDQQDVVIRISPGV